MKREYDSPLLELVSVKHPTSILENASIHGPIENFGDGGDLGKSTDDDRGDFFNY